MYVNDTDALRTWVIEQSFIPADWYDLQYFVSANLIQLASIGPFKLDSISLMLEWVLIARNSFLPSFCPGVKC